MNPSDVAPMVVGVVFTVVSGAVLILRPIAKRLGNYLDMLVETRRAQISRPPDRRLAEAIERVEERLRLLEERQDFTDAMLTSGEGRPGLRAPGNAGRTTSG